ncbi:MAG: CoA-binding protein, partial [Flavisolibacter sp.]|nr:CoA-binding protein [Flavisolibacter sp.]
LAKHGHPVVAIGKRKGKVGEVEIETDHIATENVDTVTLYLNPKNQQEYYDYILSLKPKRIIFNPGTENDALIRQAKENGIEPVIGCTLVMLSIGNY